MNVPLNAKINFKGKTYRGGEELPEDYKEAPKEKPQKKAEVKDGRESDKKSAGDGGTIGSQPGDDGNGPGDR